MPPNMRLLRPIAPKLQTGVTLIELMVALAIGAFLMIGAVTVFMQSRATFRLTESVSRLQENARFAVDLLEQDVRMSHFWGFTNLTYQVDGRRDGTMPHWGLASGTCGANWVINLDNQVGGNNAYGWGCPPSPPNVFQPGSDTLIVRRVDENPIPNPLAPGALQNRVYLQSARGAARSQIFAGAAGVPANFNPAAHQVNALMANGYYVSLTSSLSTGANLVPSLRRKTLTDLNTIRDEEVMPYVEDLQVQYGVDVDLPGTPNRGSIDRYVNANDPIITPGAAGFISDAEILAVRIWLRLRAENFENGFVDPTNYVYADRNAGVFNDRIRRLVVSKTIYLRNARPVS